MRTALAGSLALLFFAVAARASAQEAPPPPPPAQPPPPPPPPSLAPPPPHVDRVPVTVESTDPDRNVVLERRVKTDESYGRTLFVVPQHAEVQTWEQVCVAPCRAELDRASTYRIGRENEVTRSGHFTLPPSTDHVKLEVHPGSLWWHVVGAQLIAIGTAGAIVGGALLTTASTWESASDERHVRTAGIITGALGLGLLAAGIPIAVLTQTHVKANERRVVSAPPPPRLRPSGLVF